MSVFYLKACERCNGDIVDNETGDFPYCLQCSEVIYDILPDIKIGGKRGRPFKRDNMSVLTTLLSKQEEILKSNTEVIKLLKDGNGSSFIAAFLGINVRDVIKIKEILKDLGK